MSVGEGSANGFKEQEMPMEVPPDGTDEAQKQRLFAETNMNHSPSRLVRLCTSLTDGIVRIALASLLLARAVVAGFVLTDDTIEAAVNSWCLAKANGEQQTSGGDLASWNTSLVTDMTGLFSPWYSSGEMADHDGYPRRPYMATCNPEVGGWDTGAVTSMEDMFYGHLSFNGDVSGWDTGAVTSMMGMFDGASSFNGDVSGWDTGAVTSMMGMFVGASSFNGDVSGWDTGAVTSMEVMFYGAVSFNGDVSGWDTSAVISVLFMFYGASSFNGDVSGWDTGAVTSMRGMFYGASSFNGDVSGWETGAVTSMSFMFSRASSFNGDVSRWDTGVVVSMAGMFYGASSFNGDVSAFDTGAVTSTVDMFHDASSFNGEVSGWNTGAVTSMQGMFCGASSFNGEVSGWDTGSVTSMRKMFYGASSFTQMLCWGVNDIMVDDMFVGSNGSIGCTDDEHHEQSRNGVRASTATASFVAIATSTGVTVLMIFMLGVHLARRYYTRAAHTHANDTYTFLADADADADTALSDAESAASSSEHSLSGIELAPPAHGPQPSSSLEAALYQQWSSSGLQLMVVETRDMSVVVWSRGLARSVSGFQPPLGASVRSLPFVSAEACEEMVESLETIARADDTPRVSCWEAAQAVLATTRATALMRLMTSPTLEGLPRANSEVALAMAAVRIRQESSQRLSADPPGPSGCAVLLTVHETVPSSLTSLWRPTSNPSVSELTIEAEIDPHTSSQHSTHGATPRALTQSPRSHNQSTGGQDIGGSGSITSDGDRDGDGDGDGDGGGDGESKSSGSGDGPGAGGGRVVAETSVEFGGLLWPVRPVRPSWRDYGGLLEAEPPSDRDRESAVRYMRRTRWAGSDDDMSVSDSSSMLAAIGLHPRQLARRRMLRIVRIKVRFIGLVARVLWEQATARILVRLFDARRPGARAMVVQMVLSWLGVRHGQSWK